MSKLTAKSKSAENSIESIGKVSAASVKKGSGKNWDQWIAILNKLGAQNLSHQDIVSVLATKYKLNLWWQQWVAIGYEIHIGRRVAGWNAKGEYSLTTTKSLHFDSKVVWKFLFSDQGLQLWLRPMGEFKLIKNFSFETENGYYGEVRTLKAGQRLRMTLQDPDWEKKSILQLQVIQKDKNKCLLVFTHEHLRNGRLREPLKDYWKTAVEDIAKSL